MSRKQNYGKQVRNEFILLERFSSKEYFEAAVAERVSYLEKADWLYRNHKVGIVKVFRNKKGARIIAYDLPEVS